jgi:hypothetical protein
MSLNISTIIKRIELIKSLISLEEEGIIAEQIIKLEEFQSNEKINELIILLKQKSYGEAIKQIEIFITLHKQLTFWKDPEIDALKLEAKALEVEINNLSDNKADLEKIVHEFGIRHNQELGNLIIKILQFRRENAKGTAQEEETEQDYNSYHEEFESSKHNEVAILTEEEQSELKNKYRKASKLCHPDLVSDEQKELATKVFAELSNAYEKNDLVKINEILKNLENGKFFIAKSDAINEKELLKTEIEKLRLRIKELKEQIQTITESSTYETIISIDNWDEYFSNVKKELSSQLNDLENVG